MNPHLFFVAELWFSTEQWQSIGCRLRLPRRQLQVLQQIFGDTKEATIAARLGISPNTVRTYVRRLYGKVGVNSRLELVLAVTRLAVAEARQVKLSCPTAIPFSAARRAA
ncbi:MAG: helix-turn-helix transcriptional regulator [Thermoguttaceae bacterium]